MAGFSTLQKVAWALALALIVVHSPSSVRAQSKGGPITKIGRPIPAPRLQYAYLAYDLKKDQESRPPIPVSLKFVALYEDPETIERNRQYIIENGWGDEFLAMFDKEIAWAREIKGKPPTDILMDSEKWLDRRSGVEFDIGVYMAYWALTGGDLEKVFEGAMKRLSRKPRDQLGMMGLEIAGDRDHPGAILELVRRFGEEDGRDRQFLLPRALYWAERGIAIGLKLEETAVQLRNKMTEAEILEYRFLDEDAGRIMDFVLPYRK